MKGHLVCFCDDRDALDGCLSSLLDGGVPKRMHRIRIVRRDGIRELIGPEHYRFWFHQISERKETFERFSIGRLQG